MGWSLNYKAESSELSDAVLLSVGKALYLANAYEQKCKFVLKVGTMDRYIEEHPNVEFDELLSLAAKEKLLGPTISSLAQFPMVHADNVAALNDARHARNFVAHEGALFGLVSTASERTLRQHLRTLRQHVRLLLAGDNVVSRWVYMIEEKEPPPRLMSETYADLAEQWVFRGTDERA